MSKPAPCLVAIADAPSLTPSTALNRCESILRTAPPGAVMILDRDRPPAPASTGPRDRDRLTRLRALRALTTEYDAWLVVSARVDLALACAADGVQLPERGLDATSVRTRFATLKVGRSCHDRAGLLKAESSQVDWAFLSPVADPISKPSASQALGVNAFARSIEGVSIPVYGLGGIVPSLARVLIEAGAHGVACIGYLFGNIPSDVATTALISALQSNPEL